VGYATTRAITYIYDPLYRLTRADYDDGAYFRYTYDAVGNRLAEETTGATMNTYTYDIANRLISMDGVPYSWDDNGNLLSDGVHTYTYDSANRLIEVSGPEGTTSYAYNGQGDRVSQTVGITNTNYTLDLASGLTQVLSDGENTYLYGMDRIGEHSNANGWRYYLSDGLGSVRQVIDGDGDKLLARSYEPYGETLSSAGSATTHYGFTGEWTDGSTGLVYLRARYLDSGTGRFIQVDPSKIERNLYLYANANPVNRTDPTGLFSPEQIASSMGTGNTSFEVLMQTLFLTEPSLLLPDDNKWGFFSALLDAKEGDNFRAGSLILMTSHPYIQYRAPERLWLKDCNQVMIGSRKLEEYFYRVILQPTYRDLPAEYWRDTSPSYYRLSGPNTVSRIYVDGSFSTDLPDFHSIDVGFWNSARNFSGVVDRFGNKYFVLGLGRGTGGGAFYSEGYVCTSSRTCLDQNLRSLPVPSNESSIRGTIEQGCYGVSTIIDGGVSYVVCVNPDQSSALIYSFGIGLSASVNISYGFGVGKDEQMGWNWALEDRFNGVKYTDVMIKAQGR